METRSAAPLVPDVGVLALVPDHFDQLWTTRHQILTRLAQYFHVVWMNPAQEWREWRRRAPARSAGDAPTNQPPGFTVYTPDAWLPKLHRPPWLARWFFRTRLARARRALADRGCRKLILSIWRPEFEPALAAVPCDGVWYHIDDEYSFSSVELLPDVRETRLIARADVVAVHSRGLFQNKGGANPKTIFTPNGVDYEAYASARPEPADLAAIARPRIGYTGYLKRQLDWPLLLGLTAAHHEWSFVFVGPRRPHDEIKGEIDELARRPNVHLLSAKAMDVLAAYPQHFDVCILPYRADHYTQHIYPLKLHEYLASGRPAVGARIRTLEDFADVVELASTVDEWSAAITRVLSPEAQGRRRQTARQAVAKQHDWQVIVRRVAELMADGLGQSVGAAPGHAISREAEPLR